MGPWPVPAHAAGGKRGQWRGGGRTKKLTLRDQAATLLVAAVIVPFVVYSIRGSMPFVLALAAFGRRASGSGMFERVLAVLAAITVGVAVAALIVENVWALLVPMVAGVAIVWAQSPRAPADDRAVDMAVWEVAHA
jgi:hypothetical protein